MVLVTLHLFRLHPVLFKRQTKYEWFLPQDIWHRQTPTERVRTSEELPSTQAKVRETSLVAIGTDVPRGTAYLGLAG